MPISRSNQMVGYGGTSAEEGRWATLDAAIARAIADADAGRLHSLDEVREQMRLRFGEGTKSEL